MVPSKNQYRFFQLFPACEEQFTSRDIADKLQIRNKALGGFLSGLRRSKYIEPLYRSEDNGVVWKRIK